MRAVAGDPDHAAPAELQPVVRDFRVWANHISPSCLPATHVRTMGVPPVPARLPYLALAGDAVLSRRW